MRLLTLTLLLGACPAWLGAGALGETAVTMPSPYRPMSAASNFSGFRPAAPGDQLRPMRHRWGFGFDAVPGLSAPSGGALAQPNALTLRWWATDRLAVDFSGAMASQAVSASAATNGSLQSYGGAVGLRYVVSEPTKDLLVQAVMRGAYAQAAPGSDAQTLTDTGFLGLGFEAFVPGWEWISIEGTAGASYLSQTGARLPSTSSVGVGAGGTSPLNLSVHVYF